MRLLLKVLWVATMIAFAVVSAKFLNRIGTTWAAACVCVALVLIHMLQRSLRPHRPPPPIVDWATKDTSPHARVWRGHPWALFETHAEACARREDMPDSAAWRRAIED